MLSWITFSWIWTVVYPAYKKDLTPDDVWNMDELNSCRHVSNHFELEWDSYVSK